MDRVDVICAGLMVVNFPVYPVDEGLFARDVTRVEPITLLPGGDAANQAIILSRMRAKVALATRRGQDDFGAIALQLMRSHGVNIDLSGVVADPEEATGACAMMIRPDGQRHFCSHKGALHRFCFADVDQEQLRQAKVISIGGLGALYALNGPDAARLFQAARGYGVTTVADTKYDPVGLTMEGIRQVLEHTDYFFPSYDEAALLTGERTPQAMAAAFLNGGARHVGIKLGADGCYFADGDRSFTMPVFPSPVVDTTGAGDNFMAGFITGLLQGWAPEECCRFGTAAGAICVGQVGPTSAVQSMEQVQAFLDSLV